MPSAIPASIAVIPARGGSKRIPRKNVRPFAGRPMIAWTIESCLRSGAFSEVVVSTDDIEIADIARSAGAHVPFTRPAELADDHATTAAVMAHAVTELHCAARGIELACCVYPAAVLISSEDLLGAREVLTETGAQYVGSVVRFSHPIQRALAMDADGRLRLDQPEFASTRTQDLPPRWHDAGQFYWGRVSAWATAQPYFESAAGYELPAWRAIDIDTEDDWVRAEAMFAVVRGSSG